MSHRVSNTKQRQRASENAEADSWAIELKLTRADLEAMPAGLRHQLLAYLERLARPEASETAAARLERQHVATLLREISFHKLGRSLRALLDSLTYDDDASAPSRQKLAEALPASDRPRLGRYVAVLNRIAAKAAKEPGLQVCSFQRSKGIYTAHPGTRKLLRDLLPGIERAGENEEPLWG